MVKDTLYKDMGRILGKPTGMVKHLGASKKQLPLLILKDKRDPGSATPVSKGYGSGKRNATTGGEIYTPTFLFPSLGFPDGASH